MSALDLPKHPQRVNGNPHPVISATISGSCGQAPRPSSPAPILTTKPQTGRCFYTNFSDATGVLALLAGPCPLKALATTADDQYISILTQRGVAVSDGSRAGVISLGQSTAQKITTDLSDHGLAYTATKVWQIAQQDYGLSDVPTTKAQKFTVAVTCMGQRPPMHLIRCRWSVGG